MTITQIAEAISRHRFSEAYDHFTDDISWNLINEDGIEGKDAVKKTCEDSAKYLATVQTTFNSFTTYTTENTVIIESSASYVDEKQETSQVASCDIYSFFEGKLNHITSYNIELHSK